MPRNDDENGTEGKRLEAPLRNLSEEDTEKIVFDAMNKSLNELGYFVIRAMVAVNGVSLGALVLLARFSGELATSPSLDMFLVFSIVIFYGGVVVSIYLATCHHVELMKIVSRQIGTPPSRISQFPCFRSDVPRGSIAVARSFNCFIVTSGFGAVLLFLAYLL